MAQKTAKNGQKWPFQLPDRCLWRILLESRFTLVRCRFLFPFSFSLRDRLACLSPLETRSISVSRPFQRESPNSLPRFLRCLQSFTITSPFLQLRSRILFTIFDWMYGLFVSARCLRSLAHIYAHFLVFAQSASIPVLSGLSIHSILGLSTLISVINADSIRHPDTPLYFPQRTWHHKWVSSQYLPWRDTFGWAIRYVYLLILTLLSLFCFGSRV